MRDDLATDLSQPRDKSESLRGLLGALAQRHKSDLRGHLRITDMFQDSRLDRVQVGSRVGEALNERLPPSRVAIEYEDIQADSLRFRTSFNPATAPIERLSGNSSATLRLLDTHRLQQRSTR